MNTNLSDQFQSWLASHAGFNGLLACCVGFANKTCLCASASDQFQGQAMNLVMRCLSDAFDVASMHRIPTAEQRWTFGDATILCARRPDRHFIALFLERNGVVDMERARQVIEEFKTFSLST